MLLRKSHFMWEKHETRPIWWKSTRFLFKIHIDCIQVWKALNGGCSLHKEAAIWGYSGLSRYRKTAPSRLAYAKQPKLSMWYHQADKMTHALAYKKRKEIKKSRKVAPETVAAYAFQTVLVLYSWKTIRRISPIFRRFVVLRNALPFWILWTCWWRKFWFSASFSKFHVSHRCFVLHTLGQ